MRITKTQHYIAGERIDAGNIVKLGDDGKIYNTSIPIASPSMRRLLKDMEKFCKNSRPPSFTAEDAKKFKIKLLGKDE